MKTIPAVIALPLNDKQRLIQGLIENEHREDLNPIDKALAYQTLIDLGMTQTEVARMVGHAINTIETYLDWLIFDGEIQQLVALGWLPVSKRASRALLSVPDDERRLEVARRLARPGGAPIKVVEGACERARIRLEEERQASLVRNKQMPSLYLALEAGQVAEVGDGTATPWDVVRQAAASACGECPQYEYVGLDEPAWLLLKQAAGETCRTCDLRIEGADLRICRQCPAPAILRKVVIALQEGRANGRV